MDIFYLNQSKALAELHAASITLSNKLYNARKAEEVALHANELYDPNEGNKLIAAFVLAVRAHEGILGRQRVLRIIRHRQAAEGTRQLDYDIARAETLQKNIEYEIGLLWRERLLVCALAWIGAATIAYGTIFWLILKAFLWRGIL